MHISLKILFVNSLFLVLFSCKEKATELQNSDVAFSASSSKCQLSLRLAKVSVLDSLFEYSFSDNLILDFSVRTNCCPDSNRFVITQYIGADTLNIIVTDTAQHLCRCNCPYFIHAEYKNLTGNQYVVRCILETSAAIPPSASRIIHCVTVYRKDE